MNATDTALILDDAAFAPILDAVVARTRHEMFRAKTDRSHPEWQQFREAVLLIHRGQTRRAPTVATPPPEPLTEPIAPVSVEYPPIRQQIANAAEAAVSITADGFTKVGEEEAARRLSICQGCDYYDRGPERCKACGCWLSHKTAYRATHCPLDPPKW